MNEKILIITGDGGESYEVLYATHRFQEANMVPVIASTRKGPIHLVRHDFEPGWDSYIETVGYSANADTTFDEVNVDDYIGILLIGGRAPEYLRNNKTLIKIIQEFDTKDKWIWPICHGILLYTAAGLAKDKNLTCYEHCRPNVEVNGGTWDTQGSVRDGKVITAQTWVDHPGFYRLIFQGLSE